MKLFYGILLIALIGMFGCGEATVNGEGDKEETANGGDTEAGDPAPGDPAPGDYVITSNVMVDVQVTAGDLSVTLKTGKCIAISQDQITSLQINLVWFGSAQVLCGAGGQEAACEAKNVTVTPGDVDADADTKPDSAVLIDTVDPKACSSKLEKAEAEGKIKIS